MKKGNYTSDTIKLSELIIPRFRRYLLQTKLLTFFFLRKWLKKKHFSSFLIPLVVHLSTRNFFLSSDMSENYVKLLCRVYCVFVVPPPSVWWCHTLITHRLNFDLIDRWLEVKKTKNKKNRSRQFSNGHSVTCSWTCVMLMHLGQAWANH